MTDVANAGRAGGRLADVLGGLSLATDLAAGVPMETSLRTSVVASLVARRLTDAPAELADVFYASLLRHLGCTAYAHETARFADGDDHHVLRSFEAVDRADRLATLGAALGPLGADAGGARGGLAVRARRALGVVANPGAGAALAVAQCAQATALAADLALPQGTIAALALVYARHDGRGTPDTEGAALPLAARVLHVANVVEVQHRHGGRQAVLDALTQRRGAHLAPDAVDAVLASPSELWPLLEEPSVWDRYLESEPEPLRRLSPGALDEVALAFARYADLKAPSRLGHSTGVASLVETASRASGFDEALGRELRRAALLHDLGVVSVPNGIWEKRGPLGPAEWERVRLHAYYTERVLARAPAFAMAAELAGAHHERADGSGYPRGVVSPRVAHAAQVLAAADTYQALTTARPHRAALERSRAHAVLREEALRGRLDARAVDAVLEAAGHARSRDARPSAGPAALTPRELTVLTHVARGATNKELAAALGITPRTAAHHVEHIYEKLGVSTRAAAALYAARHGLALPDDDA